MTKHKLTWKDVGLESIVCMYVLAFVLAFLSLPFILYLSIVLPYSSGVLVFWRLCVNWDDMETHEEQVLEEHDVGTREDWVIHQDNPLTEIGVCSLRSDDPIFEKIKNLKESEQ